MKGLKSASKATGGAIAKIPVLKKSPVDEVLLDAGDKLEKLGSRRAEQQMQKLVERQSSVVRPFIENIETVERLYNNPITMAFDKDTVYLGIAE